MIRISQLKLLPGESTDLLEKQIRRQLHLKQQEKFSYTIARQSIDARKKPQIRYVYTVDVSCERENDLLRHLQGRKNGKSADSISQISSEPYHFPQNAAFHPEAVRYRPVITGSGPAGLFCALMLARSGLRPVVVERGDDVDTRTEAVNRFWEGGPLDPQSNVQFGEGGAGTFSDGKLNTGIRDPEGRILFVLREFVRAGADPDILYSYKPHIGTDVLRTVVKNIRQEIVSLGGTFLFRTQLVGIHTGKNGSVTATLRCAGEEAARAAALASGAQVHRGEDQPDGRLTFSLVTDALVLAIGHSARDTFEMLAQEKVAMEAKDFAVGVRVQHPQALIDQAMYGKDCPYELPPAPYKLTGRSAQGKGVYSFCMCPGGYIVNASSEPGRLCVNGMSYHDRASRSANSAIVVTVSREDFGGSDLLAGIRFQRTLEERAFQAGNGAIPVQRLGDFRRRQATGQFGRILPVCRGRSVPGDIRNIFPENVSRAIEEGMTGFGRKIPGFDDPDVLLCGVESRTSSPVRILRGDDGQSLSHRGVYPCGEGAGYAGGITSAAVDGIRTAEKIFNFLLH